MLRRLLRLVWLLEAAGGDAAESTALMAGGDEIISGCASSNFSPFEG
jgi:hypothetical protein